MLYTQVSYVQTHYITYHISYWCYTIKVLPTPPLRFSPQPGNTVQLSASGYQFLTDLFRKYDKDGDNALSTAEQEVSHI